MPQVVAALPDVPFLCDFPRAISIMPQDPYAEISRYLSVHRASEAQVLETLSYFDCANLSRRAAAHALFSVELADESSPPATVFAAYNAYGGPKSVKVYSYNDHKPGGECHRAEQLRWMLALRLK